MMSIWVETQMNAYTNIQIPDDLLPVAYASKTLTDAETRYANIERITRSGSQGGEIPHILLWQIYLHTI